MIADTPKKEAEMIMTDARCRPGYFIGHDLTERFVKTFPQVRS